MFEDKPWHKHLPPTTEGINEHHLEQFFTTMHQRQQAWWNRFILKQRPPWTSDPIISNYKFTNVYRELDRSSQYLINNVLLKETDPKQVLFSILIHRIYNKPETFKHLAKLDGGSNYTASGYPMWQYFDVEEFVNTLKDLENTGVRTLNQEAYKINTYIWPGVPRWKAYAENIIGAYHKNLDQIYHTIKNCGVEAILKQLRILGVGGFLAHEYFQDICDARIYFDPKFAKVDRNSWTNVGPGCSVGLRLIFPSLPADEQIHGIYMLRDHAHEYLDRISKDTFKYYYWDIKAKKHVISMSKCNISLHQIEMWLCEYQKYWKMQIGIGKQRAKFVPKSVIN